MDKVKILIVEDDTLYQELIKRSFEQSKLPYEYRLAGSLTEAYEALNNEQFDLIFTDLFLPDGDGVELLTNQAGNDKIHVILMSAYGDVDIVDTAIKEGAFDFITKSPAMLSDFPIIIESILKSSKINSALPHTNIAFEKERALFRTFIDSIPDSIYFKDLNSRFIRINKAMAKYFGLKDAILAIGKSDFDFFDKEHAQEAYDCEQKIIKTGEIFQSEEKEIWPNGRVSWVSTIKMPCKDCNGKITGTFGISKDITFQKEAEETIRQYGHIFNYMNLGMAVFYLVNTDNDRSLKLVNINPSAESMLDMKSSEMIGKTIDEFAPGLQDGDLLQMFYDIIKDGEAREIGEIRYELKPGKMHYYYVHAFPLPNQHIGITFVDITEQKFHQTQSLHSQKLESIGQLAAGIAHEINTPTQYVGDNTRFFKESCKDIHSLFDEYSVLLAKADECQFEPEVVQKIHDKIDEVGLEYILEEIPQAIDQTLEGVQRISQIVSAMREFSHPSANEKVTADLNHLIETTVTIAKNEWKYVADMVTEFDPDLSYVPCYPDEFNQVILNIIVNAAHAIGATIDDKSGAKGEIKIKTLKYDHHVEVQISDTGNGIPENIQSKIFDPFFTTKEVGKGTGQGLAISHNVIVNKHGGNLTFSTKAGEGTTFYISLPLNV